MHSCELTLNNGRVSFPPIFNAAADVSFRDQRFVRSRECERKRVKREPAAFQPPVVCKRYGASLINYSPRSEIKRATFPCSSRTIRATSRRTRGIPNERTSRITRPAELLFNRLILINTESEMLAATKERALIKSLAYLLSPTLLSAVL